MAKRDYKFFVEFSTSKIRGCLVDLLDDKKPVLRFYHVPTTGIKLGSIVDFDAVFESFLKLMEVVENDGFLKVDRCSLVVSSASTVSRSSDCKLSLNGLTASNEHAKRLKEDSHHGISTDRDELVELVEQEWRVDGDVFDSFPLGKTGHTLSLSAFCYFVDKTVLKPFVEVCNQAGLAVTDLSSSQVGLRRLISRLSGQSSNMVILDLGHLSTSGILCVGQKENSTFTVRAGSQHVTRDIAAALHCSLSEAESLKIRQGLQILGREPKLLGGTVSSSEETSSQPQSHTQVYPWAAPRVSEIFSLCLKHFAIYAKALDGGVMLVGGGSQLIDICSFLSAKFGGVKVARFKPNRENLESALGVSIAMPDEISLSGFEGILEQSWNYSQKATRPQNAFGITAPKMLRPLLTWFIDLSK